MLDRMDCLALLRHLVVEDLPAVQNLAEMEAVECEKGVETATALNLFLSFQSRISIAMELIRRTPAESKLSEADAGVVDSSISELVAFYGDRYEQLANPANWNGSLPIPLFVDCPGSQPPHKINHVSTFKVRGKNYMNDRKKVSLAASPRRRRMNSDYCGVLWTG